MAVGAMVWSPSHSHFGRCAGENPSLWWLGLYSGVLRTSASNKTMRHKPKVQWSLWARIRLPGRPMRLRPTVFETDFMTLGYFKHVLRTLRMTWQTIHLCYPLLLWLSGHPWKRSQLKIRVFVLMCKCIWCDCFKPETWWCRRVRFEEKGMSVSVLCRQVGTSWTQTTDGLTYMFEPPNNWPTRFAATLDRSTCDCDVLRTLLWHARTLGQFPVH